jgi:hypothetical protein
LPTDAIHFRHRLVRFRLADVFLPEPRELALALHGEDELCGRIADVSQTAGDEAFAVVAVEGCDRPVLVPVRRLVLQPDRRPARTDLPIPSTPTTQEPTCPPFPRPDTN